MKRTGLTGKWTSWFLRRGEDGDRKEEGDGLILKSTAAMDVGAFGI